MSVVNRHLSVIRRYLDQRFFEVNGFRLPKEPSAYSVFLIDHLSPIITRVVRKLSEEGIIVGMVTIRGATALGLAVPFHSEIAEKELSPNTFELMAIIYSWLFSTLGKSGQPSNLRFLGKEFSTEINLDFYLSEAPSNKLESAALRVEEQLLSQQDVVIPLSIDLISPGQIDIKRLLTSYVIYGWEQAEKTLQQADKDQGDRLIREAGAEVYACLSKPLHLKDLKTWMGIDLPAQLIHCYQTARNTTKAIILDLGKQPADLGGDGWRKANETFFRTLMTGEFDEIQVLDATKNLDDKKGEAKENQYTLCKVLGLRVGGKEIPAEKTVLKLRGFSWYRGEVHNIIDLLKEFASYRFIYSRAIDASRYFLRSGPLLLSCEKLNLQFDQGEKKRWVGLFLEEMIPPRNGRAFTCRVRRLSDFWSLDATRERVLREASENGIQIDSASLTQVLGDLAKWLWINELSLDYCDLTLFLTQGGAISEVKIIDLERLAFGELVNEGHPILDCLIDVKSYLLPEAWHETLNALYLPISGRNHFLPLEEIRRRLRRKGRQRWMIINLLHGVASVTRSLDPQKDARLWQAFLHAAFRLTSLLNRRIPHQG